MYGPVQLEVGSIRELALVYYRDNERRRGLYRDLSGALSHMKNPQMILDGLIHASLFETTKKGPTLSQKVAFIRSLQKVDWKQVFHIENDGYAEDRRAKMNDPIMRNYL